jgi:pimeloyl-ACP methyl ester carboxylesterase
MSQVISKDGTSIAYDKTGIGPAVLLVDGAMTYRAFFGLKGPLSAKLSKHFTVYTYDRRGRGESTDTKPYAVEREIEDIEALIEKAGGSVYLFGISSGAVLALKAASKLSAKVAKLALYEAPLSLGDEAKQASAQYTKQLTELLDADKRGDAVALFMTTVGLPAEMIKGMQHSPEWPIMEALAPTLAYDNAIMGRGSLPVEAAKAATMPTLVLDGSESPAFMHEAAEALAKVMPHAERKTLQGQTHEVSPKVLAPVLVAFFKV